MKDAQLWNDYKEGNRTAYEQIYRSQVEYLLNYGYRIAQDRLLVEDALHDLFVELWANRTSIGSTDNIRAYLTVSFRRKVIKSVQKRQKVNSDTPIENIQFEGELAIDDIIAASETNTETQQKLKNALSELSDRQREVLYMKYYAQLSNEEISEALEINNQSVRNLVHRSIQQLKRFFSWVLILINFLLL